MRLQRSSSSVADGAGPWDGAGRLPPRISWELAAHRPPGTEAAVVGACTTHALASLASQTSGVLGELTSDGVRAGDDVRRTAVASSRTCGLQRRRGWGWCFRRQRRRWSTPAASTGPGRRDGRHAVPHSPCGWRSCYPDREWLLPRARAAARIGDVSEPRFPLRSRGPSPPACPTCPSRIETLVRRNRHVRLEVSYVLAVAAHFSKQRDYGLRSNALSHS
jgi:hypothetical protein